MNFADSQVIRHGPRAGQPRPITDIVLDGITAAREIAIRLKRNGFTVINCIVGSGLPTVQVAACRLTAELIAAGGAADFMQTTVSGTPERHFSFNTETNDGRAVRVIWVERGSH